MVNAQPMHCQDPEPALWDELADSCLEHDQAHERHVLEQLRQVHVPTHRESQWPGASESAVSPVAPS